MTSNTIKIPHIAPHRPGVGGGGVGVSIDKCISAVLFKIYLTYSAKVRGLNFQIGLSSSPSADYLFFGCIFVREEKHAFDLFKCRETVGI